MKKKSLACLIAFSMLASTITGCGKSAAPSGGDEQTITENSSQDSNENENADDQDTDTKIVSSDAKWDGTFDYQGLEVKIGMSVNDILSQGDYVVYTDEIPEDEEGLEYVEKAVTDMVVNPILASSVGGDRVQNEVLYVYKKDGDNLDLIVEGGIFYYNPNPYAIPLGECLVAYAYDGYPVGYEGFDTNNDGNVDVDEFAAATGTEPVEVNSKFRGIAFDDFYVTLRADSDDIIQNVNAAMYGLSGSYDDAFEDLEEEHYFGGYEVVYNSIEPSQCPLTFKTGFGTFSLDVSEFASIDRISQTYIEESDFTPRIMLEGTLKDGTEVEYDINCGDEELYLPIEKYHGQYKYDLLEQVEVGDDAYYAFGDMAIISMYEGSIYVKMNITCGTDEEFISGQNAIKNAITKVE